MPETSEAAQRIADLAVDLGLEPADIEAITDEPLPDTPPADEPTFTTSSAVRIQPIPHDTPEVGDYTAVEVTDWAQAEEIAKKRPTCPTCGFVPTEEDDPLCLPIRRCYQCATEVCPECGTECRACGKPMCDAHREGHGLDNEPLCAPHAAQVAAHHEHTRDLARRAEARKLLGDLLSDERTRRERAWTRQKERDQLVVDRHQQRFDNKVTAAKLKLAILQLKAARRARRAGMAQPAQRPQAQPPAPASQQAAPPGFRGDVDVANPVAAFTRSFDHEPHSPTKL